MIGAIVYKSKYGATKKYAEWLREKTGYDLLELSNITVKDLLKYEILIFGGGIYASGVPVTNFLKKNYSSLSQKKIIVFCDGASPYEEKTFLEIKERVMTGELKDIPFFYCRGAWNMEVMSFVDKNLCKMFQKAVAKKDSKDYKLWECALMEAGNDSKDWTDPTYLEPILEEIERMI
ncbi:MAG: flavodoxin domain-containing protein [Bacillota bacterium]|nr:flavodoxin domain-containing protein [Bacillota bacterium]